MSTTATSLSGPELRLMLKHRRTIAGLTFQLGLTQKRVRDARENGLKDGYAVRDWTQAITGVDPGPLPEKYRIRHHSEEAACCQCGCPLCVGDLAYEYVGDAFCSTQCARQFRGWN